MKIVGTIVNQDINLIGLLIKGKPSEFGVSQDSKYMMRPFDVEDVKSLIRGKKIKDYKIDKNGNIVGENKKLSDLPMFDSYGNPVDKRIEIRSAIEDNGNLAGAVIFFPSTGMEKKLKLDDLSKVYNYCEPVNFTLRSKDNGYYFTGKDNTRKEDIPVIDRAGVSKKKVIDVVYQDLSVNSANRDKIGYKGDTDEILEIPSKIEKGGQGYIIKEISARAFQNCSNILSIKIPDTVEEIYQSAFLRCNGLKTVEIPDTVIAIYNHAFSFCDNLETFKIGKGVEILNLPVVSGKKLREIKVNQNNPYYCDSNGVLFTKDKKKLLQYPEGRVDETYVVPDGVEVIGMCAFKDAIHLKNVVLPRSVKKVDSFAFENCLKLNSIKMENTLKYLDPQSFTGCKSLKSIVLYETLQEISEGLFFESGIRKVYFTGTEKEWKSKLKTWVTIDDSDLDYEVEFNYNGGKEIEYIPFNLNEETFKYLDNSSLIDGNNLRIPSTFKYNKKWYKIVSIDRGALPTEILTGIENIYIPDSVIDILKDSVEGGIVQYNIKFYDIKNIYLGSGVKNIGIGLDSCCNIENIFVSPENPYFCDVDGVLFSKDMTTLLRYPLCKKTDIACYTVPDGVRKIRDYAFFETLNLNKIILPDGLLEIGDFAFNSCYISNIELPDSLVSIGLNAFQFSDIEEVILSDNTIKIGNDAFSCMSKLVKIRLPNGLKEIHNGMFRNCKMLEIIDIIPENIKKLGSDAFNGCENLKFIAIPEKVNHIGASCFKSCNNLKTIRYDGQKIQWIDIQKDENWDLNTGSLVDGYVVEFPNDMDTKIPLVVSKENISKVGFQDIDGEELVIPEEIVEDGITYIIKGIDMDAFNSCKKLVSLTLPNTVEFINSRAFAYCRMLRTVNFSNKLTIIGNEAFYGCKCLNNVELPDSVTYIGSMAFGNCVSIENIKLSKIVNCIEDCAFQFCESLKEISIPLSLERIGNSVFFNCYNLKRINYQGEKKQWQKLTKDCNLYYRTGEAVGSCKIKYEHKE